jgi:mannose-6-phosphate isomerase-like protein (cupin superfamily)
MRSTETQAYFEPRRHRPEKVLHNRAVAWQTQRIGPNFDHQAPDGSEIRLLVQVRGASMVYCTLQPGLVTRAVRHRSVEELWLCVSGAGQLWRREPATKMEEIVELEAGVSVSIPLGTAFQFRAVGERALEVVITTLPPWPGPQEAVPVAGVWPVRQQ